mgnify:CR=1 FL=1
MLAYARTLVGKPFSNMGMARSIFFPRKTDGESFFCAGAPRPHPRRLRLLTRHAARAELVAAILQRGGLMCAHPPLTPHAQHFQPWSSLHGHS